jgi:hypothetical protein
VLANRFHSARRRVLHATLWALSTTAACVFAQAPQPHSTQEAQVSGPAAAPVAVVADVPLHEGGFQRVLYFAPASPPRGILVMFPGGADDLGIEKSGAIVHADNFLVRTHDLWSARGYGVLLVDQIGHESMRGKRSTDEYAEVTKEIIAFAHRQANVPVWAVGTSQGSIAAMNAASHAGNSQLAGVILTESVSILGASHETVFDAHPADVRVPALVVANEDDRCSVAPPSMADDIARSMTGTRVTVLRVRGGTGHSSNDCSSLSPHGYYGIEDEVVSDIVKWMERTRS